MAITRTDANGNDIYITDPNGNEIGTNGKRKAGVLLILATLLTLAAIIAHWPDKLPPVNQKADTKYYYKLFSVTYAGEGGVGTEESVVSLPQKEAKKDKLSQNDSGTTTQQQADTPTKQALPLQHDSNKETTKKVVTPKGSVNGKCIIDLNTLLLLLVALSGFLGNMIHISSSFSDFVGAGKFKRSWMLWYFVKPFTAAALAVVVYIIFRAGFLNSGEAIASVNLYGVVGIALLAGLYTDMATQKLKEVFGVIFKTTTERPDKLTFPPVKITGVIPDPLPLNTATQVIVSGEGFGNRKFIMKIDGQVIDDLSIKPNVLIFNYTATKDKPELILYDEKNVEVLKFNLIVTPPPTVSDISNLPNLTAGTETQMTITGTGLTASGITVTITDANDPTKSTVIADADLTKTDTTIVFKFTPSVAGNFTVDVAANGVSLKTQSITVS